MRKKKRILTVLTVFFVLLFCVSGFLLIKETTERQTDQNHFDDLNRIAYMNTSGSVQENAYLVEEGESVDVTEEVVHERNISLLIEENEDCIGWIYIDGTRVNYPVMHTPSDPEKYLRRNFYGEYSVSGVPFMDGDSRLSDMHIIIYGHNMRNDTMFGDVVEYVDPAYRDAHPMVEFETETGCTTYEIFAVAVVDATDDWYFTNPADQPENYAEKIDYIQSIALYETGIVPEYGEKLLTLSTCYGSDDDTRLIVVAVERN